MSILISDVREAFMAVGDNAMKNGYVPEGFTLGLQEHDQINGRGFRIMLINNESGGWSFPAKAKADGYLGWTKREAYKALTDLKYAYSEPA